MLALRALLDMPAELAELKAIVRRAPPPALPPAPVPQRVSVVVLWSGGRGPQCASLSTDRPGRLDFRCDAYPIPAGSWVVAIGGELGNVFVGSDLQNAAGVMGCGLVLRLQDGVQIGSVLRVFVP